MQALYHTTSVHICSAQPKVSHKTILKQVGSGQVSPEKENFVRLIKKKKYLDDREVQ